MFNNIFRMNKVRLAKRVLDFALTLIVCGPVFVEAPSGQAATNDAGEPVGVDIAKPVAVPVWCLLFLEEPRPKWLRDFIEFLPPISPQAKTVPGVETNEKRDDAQVIPEQCENTRKFFHRAFLPLLMLVLGFLFTATR